MKKKYFKFWIILDFATSQYKFYDEGTCCENLGHNENSKVYSDHSFAVSGDGTRFFVIPSVFPLREVNNCNWSGVM